MFSLFSYPFSMTLKNVWFYCLKNSMKARSCIPSFCFIPLEEARFIYSSSCCLFKSWKLFLISLYSSADSYFLYKELSILFNKISSSWLFSSREMISSCSLWMWWSKCVENYLIISKMWSISCILISKFSLIDFVCWTKFSIIK